MVFLFIMILFLAIGYVYQYHHPSWNANPYELGLAFVIGAYIFGSVISGILLYKPIVIVDENGVTLWKQFYPWDNVKEFSKPYGGYCVLTFADSVSLTPPKKLKEGIRVEGNRVTISQIINYLVLKEAFERYGKDEQQRSR